MNEILHRLRYGADATCSPFEPRSRIIYALLAGELFAIAILIAATGFTISPLAIVVLPFWSPLLCVAAMLLRRFGHSRLTGAMEATALVYGQGILLLFLLFPLTAISAPFADESLAAVGRFVGFDWLAFASLFVGHRYAQWALVVVYHSFNWQPLLVVLLLFISNRHQRGWQFVTAATIAALLTAVLFPLAPALGTYNYFDLDPAWLPRMQAGWQFAPVLHEIKDAGVREINPAMFTGLVSFPSYHAAAATIFGWAAWPLGLRWFFVVLNAGVCVSALIVGAHYLVDIVAGVIIGAAAIWLAALKPKPKQQSAV